MRRLLSACALLFSVVLSGCAPQSPPAVADAPLAAAPALRAQSHDRYQNLSYTVTGPNTVRFELRGGFRASFYLLDDCRTPAGGPAACTGPGGLPAVGDYVDMDASTSNSFAFGDGTFRSGSMTGRVTAVDAAGDLLYARAITQTGSTIENGFTKTYAGPGPYTALFQACCRLDGANTGTNDNYRVRSVVSFAGNTANPVTTLPPVVDCVVATPCSFSVPAADPDGHVLVFRLSNQPSVLAETGIGGALPGSISPAGLYSVPAISAAAGTVFATQVTIEERLGSPSGTLIATTPVDFLIRLVTGNPPAFNTSPPFPSNGQVFTVNVGTPLSFQVRATDPDGTPVTVSDLGLPPGATFGGCVAAGGTTTCDLAWTPEADEAGNSFVVAFTARDASNVSAAPYSVTIQVPANTPPTLTLPANQSAEATSAAGAAVSFSAGAADAEDGALTPVCTPASGSTFALGTTTVMCTVTDSGGLSASGSFTVTVADTTPPTLSPPANVSVTPAPGQFSMPVSYPLPAASDAVDSSVSVVCTPASGSTFALGTTTVTCTATDDAGNSAQASFTVAVRFAVQGFFQPVRMNELNVIKAGSGVPLKFSLGGDWGLNILAAGSPSSMPVSCTTLGALGPAVPTDASGGSDLHYDGQYGYVWKTEKAWADTCRTVRVTLLDGTALEASFRLR
ncbi:PxKF domain-containing protein [Deinococcus aquaedulcis]|uniref:PxKF domain-containing protein n=1 Tax=Deinococcus aquaedulcis TaxID=2840455 RepID=UPI001C82ED84|nr:PxKF domain-containing protein [Deinococcus aquaedulcis]